MGNSLIGYLFYFILLIFIFGVWMGGIFILFSDQEVAIKKLSLVG